MTASAISAVLAADLVDLCCCLRSDLTAVTEAVAVTKRDLRLAVRSALGFSIVVHRPPGPPLILHVVDQPLQLDGVAATLRLDLVGPTAPWTVTLYADRPNVFAELAAELAEALGVPAGSAVLDAPQPAEVIETGLVGTP